MGQTHQAPTAVSQGPQGVTVPAAVPANVAPDNEVTVPAAVPANVSTDKAVTSVLLPECYDDMCLLDRILAGEFDEEMRAADEAGEGGRRKEVGDGMVWEVRRTRKQPTQNSSAHLLVRAMVRRSCSCLKRTESKCMSRACNTWENIARGLRLCFVLKYTCRGPPPKIH